MINCLNLSCLLLDACLNLLSLPVFLLWDGKHIINDLNLHYLPVLWDALRDNSLTLFLSGDDRHVIHG